MDEPKFRRQEQKKKDFKLTNTLNFMVRNLNW